jgi:hypothetical protein
MKSWWIASGIEVYGRSISTVAAASALVLAATLPMTTRSGRNVSRCSFVYPSCTGIRSRSRYVDIGG